jgi:hypothetical protein
MPISNAHELFVHELGTIYDAEHQFVEGQQEMAQQASDQDLRSAIEEHIDQTEQHIQNLEHVFEQLGQQPQRATSEVAQGLVSEAQQNMQEAPERCPPRLRDQRGGNQGRALRDGLLPGPGHGCAADGGERDRPPRLWSIRRRRSTAARNTKTSASLARYA